MAHDHHPETINYNRTIDHATIRVEHQSDTFHCRLEKEIQYASIQHF